MGTSLPQIEKEFFCDQITGLSPRRLSRKSLEALWLHYGELRRWNEKTSLVGPAAAEDILSRHYGESLAALHLLAEPPADSRLQILDVGSGGGFPGIVLAGVLPRVSMTLVEPRQKKAAFLSGVARKASLPCRCLNVRVSRILPPGLPGHIDVVTMRALRLPTEVLAALAESLAPEGRFLLWQTEPLDEPPPGFTVGRILRLPESDRRCVAEYVRQPRSSHGGPAGGMRVQ